MACHDEPLRGSRNQEVLYFTERYSDADLPPQIAEISIGEDALVQITGYPTVEFLDEVRGTKISNRPVHKTPKAVAVPDIGDDEEDGDDLVGV